MLRRIPGVMVRPDGSVSIQAAGNLDRSYLPLVLIDGMYINYTESEGSGGAESNNPSQQFSSFDTSPLEQVSIHDIESIDVFKPGASAAVFGSRGAGGVISITTKKGIDDTAIERKDGIFIPLGYQKPVEFYSPQYETLEAKHLTIPDYRTTIFWKPDVVISNEEEETTFEFYTSDFSTTYSVVIEGLTADGRIVRQVEKIRVE